MADIDKVIAVVRGIGGVSELNPDDDIYEAGGIASMNAIQLLVELEDAFGISLDEDRFIQARTPNDLRAVIEERE